MKIRNQIINRCGCSAQQKRGLAMIRHESVDYHIMIRFFRLPFFAGFLFTTLAGVFEQSLVWAAEAVPTATSPHTSADSLREEIARLRAQAIQLRREAAGLRQDSTATDSGATETSLPGLSTSVTGTSDQHVAKDTVELLSRESTESFLHSLSGKRRGTRERGFGGAIGMVMGVYAIDMHPVDELVTFMKNDAAFANARITIDKSFAFFQFSGICGYGAVGSGLRIGGTYNSGSRSYTTQFDDTTYNIEINPSFGGFLIERALVIENVNVYFGGIIGGGNIKVKPSKATNAFTSITIDSENRTNFNELNARSLLLEAHGGFTYTMVNWFHIGADLSAPLFFSQSGFVTPGEHSVTNGFVSINPGICIRIMLGNIG